MDNGDLFRSNVLDTRRNCHYGVVRINTPIRYTVLTVHVLLFVVVLILFLLFGEFSEKFIVSGYIESAKGVARVYPKKNGVIVRSFIKQGDHVNQGDRLFLMDTSEGLKRGTRSDVLIQLEAKKRTLDDEINYKAKHLQALKTLLIKKFISVSMYHEKKDELVHLQHQINQMNVDIINHKRDQFYVVRAPIDGVITNVLYQPGQYTPVSKPLLKIIPKHSVFMAALFIPVRQSGFLSKKSSVIIRYDAYPYERFGSSRALIQEIGQSILTDEEEDKPIRIGQPYYKVLASLDKQFVAISGRHKKIQDGMTISAVIVGSRRKIWQWIFEPLYSFYGEIFI